MTNNIRDLERKHISQIREIIRNNWHLLPKKPASNLSTTEEDTKESFDMVFKESVNLSVRIRKNDALKYSDFTIRSKTKKGQKTEIDKLLSGLGHIYFYAWEDINQQYIEHFIIVDIHKATHILKHPHSRNIPNGDGTFFNAYHLSSLFSCNAVISSTIRIKAVA